jgi:hypothetical protein
VWRPPICSERCRVDRTDRRSRPIESIARIGAPRVIDQVGDEALAVRREKAARVPSDNDPEAERNVVVNDGREPDPLAWEQQSGRHDRHPVAGRGEFQ